MNRSFVNVLNKQMTRKEFFKYLGIMFVSVFGISSLMKSLSELDISQKSKKANISKSNFGTGVYGG